MDPKEICDDCDEWKGHAYIENGLCAFCRLNRIRSRSNFQKDVDALGGIDPAILLRNKKADIKKLTEPAGGAMVSFTQEHKSNVAVTLPPKPPAPPIEIPKVPDSVTERLGDLF